MRGRRRRGRAEDCAAVIDPDGVFGLYVGGGRVVSVRHKLSLESEERRVDVVNAKDR